jgi:hypothetical protein
MSDLSVNKVLGDDCKAIANELLQQPELLSAVFLEKQDRLTPEQELQVKRFTGARSARDDQRLVMVGALRLLGASDREIARSCGVSRNSVPVLLQELERSGRVEPLKERLVKVVGDNAERSSLLLRRLMENALDGQCDVDLASMIKAVGSVNCFQLEKYQLLTGQATERIETVAGAGRAEAEAWLRSCAVPIEAQVDSKSVGDAEKLGVSGDVLPVVTDVTRLEPSQPPPTEPAADHSTSAERAGGGSVVGGPGETPTV